MKKISALLILLVIASCSRDEVPTSQGTIPVAQREPLTPAQINGLINQSLETKGSFDWREASTHLLWSAAVHGDYILSIGFGRNKDDIDRTKSSAQAAKYQSQIISKIEELEGLPVDKILLSADQFLNMIDVVVTKQETVMALRKLDFIRYVEPGNYRYFSHETSGQHERVIDMSETSSSGSSGCGYESVALSPADYTTISPNAKAGWTLYAHNVPSAWTYSTGAGVTIGIVDTGTSTQQSLLGSSFNNGLSSGRTIQKYGVYVDSIWPWSTGTDGANDLCGHGTSMASAAAAPRNNVGLPVGVAYNANLVTYRAASNVVLDGYHEQNGVKNAFTALGNNASVKIISMSMGHVFSVGKISDGIKYAYNKGKLIFCAGGTSTSFTTFVGVIFPASMAEAVAVTGVKEGSTYQKCDVCHTGSKIEFTVAMQRLSTGNTSPVLSYYNNQSDYVGGSSVATATTAGIAALVWAKNPSWTRAQVLDKMRKSAAFYPNKHSEFGYGNINALAAVQ